MKRMVYQLTLDGEEHQIEGRLPAETWRGRDLTSCEGCGYPMRDHYIETDQPGSILCPVPPPIAVSKRNTYMPEPKRGRGSRTPPYPEGVRTSCRMPSVGFGHRVRGESAPRSAVTAIDSPAPVLRPQDGGD
jgi:hypothetical protein